MVLAPTAASSSSASVGAVAVEAAFEPENNCRQCVAIYEAGVHHKHVAELCHFLQNNCWSCEGDTCHWGTWVAGACSGHGHVLCGVDTEQMLSLRKAVGENAGGHQLWEVMEATPEQVVLDESGYVLVLDCNGAVAAAFPVPATALAYVERSAGISG